MTQSVPEPHLRVVDNPAEHRFEAHLDGRLAGFAVYSLSPGRIVFVHTEVAPEFGGQGIGGRLAAAALDDVRSRGLHVVARCPFIKGYIEKHPEYADLVSGR